MAIFNLIVQTIIGVLIGISGPAREFDPSFIKLPPGFKLEVYTSDVPGARSLALGANGTVFVGTRSEGKLYAITPDREVHIIAEGLQSPNGVAFRKGSLFVAEVSRILRFDSIESHLNDRPKYQVISKTYPNKEHHGWKFIAFGADGLLYIPVGAPCNVCKSDDPIFASITRMKPDGTAREVFASGVRNTVGFDWHPTTHEMWFTDNGRDWLGDNSPPDELNRAPKAGLHFGFPFCHGGSTEDPVFSKKMKRNCDSAVKPEINLGPHVAALGMRFYSGKMFPKEYQNQIFIAEHGSWNRSNPIGYRITTVSLGSDGHAKNYQTFAEGWLRNGSTIGRPVDILVLPDGSLLVSDDHSGRIYRMSYQ